jgi:hypothetical protein
MVMVDSLKPEPNRDSAQFANRIGNSGRLGVEPDQFTYLAAEAAIPFDPDQREETA